MAKSPQLKNHSYFTAGVIKNNGYFYKIPMQIYELFVNIQKKPSSFHNEEGNEPIKLIL